MKTSFVLALTAAFSQLTLAKLRRFHPKQDYGSCAAYGCGVSGEYYDTCGCDASCVQRRDCCFDYQELCNSCYDVNCNTYEKGRTCQCNSNCKSYGNCCEDYSATCSKGMYFEDRTTAPRFPEDRRTNKYRLRVLEYNLEWMYTNFSHSSGSNMCPGDGCPWKNGSHARDHMEHVAKLMGSLDFDIGILPEVCDVWTLDRLIERMGANAPYYKAYLIKGTDTALGQNVGLVTKIDPVANLERTEKRYSYPVQGSNCGCKSYGTAGCSKHFKTRFNVANLDKPLTVVGVHFLAHPTDNVRCAKREAQASVIRDFLLESQQSDHFLIAGDYNDYDDEVMDAANSMPNSRVTQFLREWRNPQLHAVAGKIAQQSTRYSGWWDKNRDCADNGGAEHTSIDHVLVDAELLNKITDVHFDHAYKNYCNHIYSDHWPLVIDFNLR